MIRQALTGVRLPAAPALYDYRQMSMLVDTLERQLDALRQRVNTVTLAAFTRIITYCPSSLDYSADVVDNHIFLADKSYVLIAVLFRFDTPPPTDYRIDIRLCAPGVHYVDGTIIATLDHDNIASTTYTVTPSTSINIGDAISYTPDVTNTGFVNKTMVQLILVEV